MSMISTNNTSLKVYDKGTIFHATNTSEIKLYGNYTIENFHKIHNHTGLYVCTVTFCGYLYNSLAGNSSYSSDFAYGFDISVLQTYLSNQESDYTISAVGGAQYNLAWSYFELTSASSGVLFNDLLYSVPICISESDYVKLGRIYDPSTESYGSYSIADLPYGYIHGAFQCNVLDNAMDTRVTN